MASESLDLACLRALKAMECPDSTAPFFEPALVMDRALGSTVWDLSGHAYTDLCAGFGSLSLGHHPEAHRRVFEHQLSDAAQPPIIQAMGDVYASRDKALFAETLLSLLPERFRRVSLGLTGSHAVEIALKTALFGEAEPKILAFRGAYHGVDLGLLGLSTNPFFHSPFHPWLGEQLAKVRLADLNAPMDVIENIFAVEGRIAAVIVEPIQGRAGIRACDLAWLKDLSRLAARRGALLILDEVFTGFGRSGRISFAEEVDCDLICFGKGMSGGFPVSACVGTEAVFQRWPESLGEARHTGTFFGHPFSLRMAIATMQEIAGQKLDARSAELGARAFHRLSTALAGVPSVKAVRGQGLMLAIEFHAELAGLDLMHRLRTRGLIALVSGSRGESLSMTPPLNISEETLFSALDLIGEVAKHEAPNAEI